MNSIYLILAFSSVSQTFDLPPGLLSALCFVESRHNPEAIHMDDGGSASLGICEIKLNTAKGLGFKGSQKDLMQPQINIYYAGKYLKQQLVRYDGNYLKAVASYNAGKYRVDDMGATKNWVYVHKVMKTWTVKK